MDERERPKGQGGSAAGKEREREGKREGKERKEREKSAPRTSYNCGFSNPKMENENNRDTRPAQRD